MVNRLCMVARGEIGKLRQRKIMATGLAQYQSFTHKKNIPKKIRGTSNRKLGGSNGSWTPLVTQVLTMRRSLNGWFPPKPALLSQ